MSAPGPECVICGKIAVGAPGWDGGFASYRNFRAVWDPPRVFQDSVHFACLRGWEHRSAFMAEFLGLATDAVEQFEVVVDGVSHPVTRQGLGFTETEAQLGRFRILRHHSRTAWLVVDLEGGWVQLGQAEVLALAQGRVPDLEGSRGRYAITIPGIKPGTDPYAWDLPDLLDALGVTDRYPGLDQSSYRSTLTVDHFNEMQGSVAYTLTVPAILPDEVAAYFASRQ